MILTSKVQALTSSLNELEEINKKVGRLPHLHLGSNAVYSLKKPEPKSASSRLKKLSLRPSNKVNEVIVYMYLQSTSLCILLYCVFFPYLER